MTLKEQLETIKADCRSAIEAAEKATAGPWEAEDTGITWDVVRNGDGVAYDAVPNDACFIALSRTICPKAAQATLTAIEALEDAAKHSEWAKRDLIHIASDWFKP